MAVVVILLTLTACAPMPDPDKGRTLVLLTRQYDRLPDVEGRLYIAPSEAVSVIMRKLENEGLLKRGEPMRGRVGQPSVPLRLAYCCRTQTKPRSFTATWCS